MTPLQPATRRKLPTPTARWSCPRPWAILHWFDRRLKPWFTDLEARLKELFCADAPARYEQCLIGPVGQVDLQVIVDEQPNIERIVASLGLKQMTQGTLVRKLCTYTTPNSTRRAVFEFDKLVRSTYTLRYLRDPQLERTVHRSQNGIESYHQLRAAIAQVGGKKELTGRTDIKLEISNQCGRLIGTAIVLRLLARYDASGDAKACVLITQISPGAWQHILLNGHYRFHSDGTLIDPDAIVADLDVA